MSLDFFFSGQVIYLSKILDFSLFKVGMRAPLFPEFTLFPPKQFELGITSLGYLEENLSEGEDYY